MGDAVVPASHTIGAGELVAPTAAPSTETKGHPVATINEYAACGLDAAGRSTRSELAENRHRFIHFA